MTTSTDGRMSGIANLALAFSLLDSEVAPPREMTDCGRRWSRWLLATRLRAAERQADDGLEGMLEPVLQGNYPPQLCPHDNARTLHLFLDGALELALALSLGNTPPEQAAGAIYLHNPLHDELVMAASRGFPFREPKTWFQDFRTAVSKHRRDQDRDYDPKELRANLGRLHYLATVLGPRLAHTTIARHPWVGQQIRGVYRLPRQESGLGLLDCNRILIGIAYYEPGRGITAQLFDKVEGERLERPQLNDPDPVRGPATTFVQAFEGELRALIPSPSDRPLYKHLREERLQRRTVVFRERQEMAAGRQVKAGRYEGLQFPNSIFIGPFLGTVLRFNGEHLGILKVEKHKFRTSPTRPGSDNPSSWLRRRIRGFGGADAARFLLSAYALSGFLYLAKHHLGKDLSEGWTSAGSG